MCLLQYLTSQRQHVFFLWSDHLFLLALYQMSSQIESVLFEKQKFTKHICLNALYRLKKMELKLK